MSGNLSFYDVKFSYCQPDFFLYNVLHSPKSFNCSLPLSIISRNYLFINWIITLHLLTGIFYNGELSLINYLVILKNSS